MKKTTGRKNKKKNGAIKLDLGCGPHKREGFTGVDIRAFDGVDVVLDIGRKRWPWKDSSVDEAHASHFIEHLDTGERIHFVNELYRVLKPGGKCSVIVPHWCSNRAYGDLTHKWPPVSEAWFFYLNADWRKTNAPHNDEYTCDFEPGWGYALSQHITVRAQDQRDFALQNYKEAAADMHATLTKPLPKKALK